MARAKQNNIYRNFVRGLITEASYLTYPENASLDERNTVISRKGNRTRRLGMSYRDFTFVPGFDLGYSEFDARAEFVWKVVDNNAQANFLVLQRGQKILFFDTGVEPISEGKKTFEIDLSAYYRPGLISYPFNDTCQFAYGKGFLFIVHRDLEPLAVRYNRAMDSIVVTKISILVRDFEGLDDGLANDEEPTTLTKPHHYNLTNQGWITNKKTPQSSPTADTTLTGYLLHGLIRAISERQYQDLPYYQAAWTDSPIYRFHDKLKRYPGNNKQWWVARAEADDEEKNPPVKQGDFLPEVLDQLFSGNNRAPRGHWILDAFRKDRSGASGISDIPVEELAFRPNTVTFFSGRAWFGAQNTVYFSQILDSRNHTKAGLCYQEADPTAEDISDLIASDGGVIEIPEADAIQRIVPLSNGVMVFAQNGVWFIAGGDNGFAATGFSVDKVSSIGTEMPHTIVNVSDTIYWWSEVGIMALAQESGQFGPVPGKFGNENIAEQTIQSYYNAIPDEWKRFAKACYEPKTNVIHWLFNSGKFNGSYRYDSVLLFDITLQAFYPWEFGSDISPTFVPIISGFFINTGEAETPEFTSVTNLGETVTDGGVIVTSGEFITDIRPTTLTYVTHVPLQGLTFSQTVDQQFVDFYEFNDFGFEYDSYILTGYELHEDAMRDKQILYLFSHFRRTEDQFGNNPSSCTLSTRWDWANSRNSNRWSPTIEVYRPKLNSVHFDVVTSKSKVRGHGKSIQFRFGTKERGKNFDILGWSVAWTGSTEP